MPEKVLLRKFWSLQAGPPLRLDSRANYSQRPQIICLHRVVCGFEKISAAKMLERAREAVWSSPDCALRTFLGLIGPFDGRAGTLIRASLIASLK